MASQTEETMNGITWTEIPVIDIPRAKKFYSTVFGWENPVFGDQPTDPELATIAFFKRGTTNGSFVKVEPENFLSPAIHPNNPDKSRVAVRVTMMVESVDKTIQEIEKAGGKLYLPKRDIGGNMGFTIYFTDTEGNVMGIWSQK